MVEPSETGRLLAGRYQLEELLAEGGMGEVWSARHQTLGVNVAVKLMRADAVGSPVLRARFEREAQVGARLRTPHVVQVFDYGVEAGVPFLVMELLQGEDFAEVGKRKKVFSLAQTADLLGQAARGLAAAHEDGIVHRDVKPSNLFLARVSAGQNIVKVLDFGIARLSEEEKLTQTNVVLGSPSYMSPEQIMSGEIGPQTDVWGLAVVTFWMLSGELPFRGPTPADVAERILLGDRPNLSDIVSGLPDDIDDVLERALSLGPRERHASILDFMDELSRIDRAHPSLGVAQPLQEVTQRHPARPLKQKPRLDEPATIVLETLKRVPANTVKMGAAPGGSSPQLTERLRPVIPAIITFGPPPVPVLTSARREQSQPTIHRERHTQRRPALVPAIVWWVLPLVALILVVLVLLELGIV